MAPQKIQVMDDHDLVLELKWRLGYHHFRKPQIFFEKNKSILPSLIFRQSGPQSKEGLGRGAVYFIMSI